MGFLPLVLRISYPEDQLVHGAFEGEIEVADPHGSETSPFAPGPRGT